MGKKKHILVTGGAGFIGSHLVEKILAKGNAVTCLDNFNNFYCPKIKWNNIKNARKQKDFHLAKMDIRNAKKINKLFQQNQFDLVIHLAARAGVRPSLKDPLLYADVNIKGTLNLLEASVKYKVKRFIFASSSSVYGNNKQVPFTETDAVDNPISPYAATKKAGELLCHNYHHLYDLPVTCLRFFTVYGPRQRPEMAIYKFIRAIDQNETIPMFGKGNTSRDYTYIDDIVSGVMACLDKDLGYEIINLGNSKTIALRELINTIETKLGKKASIQTLPQQPGDVDRTYANISKAKKMLRYSPKTDIATGLDKTITWYQNNGK